MKSIPSFPDYAIDAHGQIWRVTRPQTNLCKNRLLPYQISVYRSRSGYYGVSVMDRKTGRAVSRRLNRLVAEAYYGPPPFAKAEASHVDGNKANNRPNNIRWVSHLANIREKYRHGTMPMGDRHPMAKLSSIAVRQIRAQATLGLKHTELAKRFGVSPSTIGRIIQNVRWV